MVMRPLRPLPPRPAHAVIDGWLNALEKELADPKTDRNLICRRTLCELLYPGIAANYDSAVNDAKLPLATRAALLSLDPRNVTLEPEYYAECDDAQFQKVKPLLWLWYSFDRTPMAGQNIDVGVRLRRILAPLIFKRCGRELQSLSARGVLLRLQHGGRRRRGDPPPRAPRRPRRTRARQPGLGLRLREHLQPHPLASSTRRTSPTRSRVLEDDVRITYHATVLAGVRVGENGMVGASALATKDVRPYHVNVGIPAKSVRVKPNAPATSHVLPSASDRREG